MITDVHAVVVDGQVVNTVVIDAATVKRWHDDGLDDQVWPSSATLINVTTIDPQPGIGWSYDGQHWTAPPPPTPDPPAETADDSAPPAAASSAS